MKGEFLFITLSSDSAYSKFTIVCTKRSFVLVKVKKFNDVACLLENYEVTRQSSVQNGMRACVFARACVWCGSVLAYISFVGSTGIHI